MLDRSGRSRIAASRETSSASASSRGRPCLGEPENDDLVVGQRPRAGHDSTDDHEIWPAADQRPPGRRHDVGVGCARTEDPLVVSRQESHGGRRGRRGQLLEILAQDVGGLPVDVDRGEAVTEARDPGLDPLAARAQPLAEPVVHVVRRRWPVRPEVRLDRTHSGLVEVRHARPARVAIQALEGRPSVSRRAEAHVALPRERLQQRAAPSANAKPRCRNLGRAVTAAPSSSRVNGPSASASRTASRSSGQSDGVRP